jgi:hypothetical protein
MRILLLLVAVVVRPPLDDLHAAHLDVRRGALGRYEAAERDDGGDGERDGREEAEDVLQPHQRGVHVGLVWGVLEHCCVGVCVVVCGDRCAGAVNCWLLELSKHVCMELRRLRRDSALCG